MQKIKTYLQLSIVLVALVTVTSSCSKSSTSTTTILGNWARGSEFEGVGRTEAVTFTIGDSVYIGGGYDGTNRLTDFWVYGVNTFYLEFDCGVQGDTELM